MRDMFHQFGPVQDIDPATLTASANGSGVDLQGFEGALIAVLVGESGDTLNGSNHIQLEVEHADDDGAGSPDSWEDCADADLVEVVAGSNTGTFAKIDDATEDDAVYHTAYIGSKRHIRVVANLTGTHSTGTPLGAVVVRGFGRHQPSSDKS